MEQKKNILIVDDDKSTCELLCGLFEGVKINTKFFLTTADAYSYLEKSITDASIPKIDLILLDIIFYEDDKAGFDLLSKIKNNANLIKIPVILMSNSVALSIAEKAKCLHAVYFLPKPYSQKEIITIVESLLSTSEKQESPTRKISERAEICILIADIRNFTGWCDNTPPEFSAEFIYKFYIKMKNLICENRGHLLKTVGDGMIAVWGYPFANSEYTDFSIKCSFEMLKNFNTLLLEFKQRGFTKFPTGLSIGINAGHCTIINAKDPIIGTDILGSPLNLTARIVQIAKENEILITQNVMEKSQLIKKQDVFFEPYITKEMKGFKKNEVPNIYLLTGSKLR